MKQNINPNTIGIVMLLIGCLFVMNGIHRQEHKTVEKKSNIVCMECIGIN